MSNKKNNTNTIDVNSETTTKFVLTIEISNYLIQRVNIKIILSQSTIFINTARQKIISITCIDF